MDSFDEQDMIQTRVLIVDDEVAITKSLTPFLERAGFAVSTAGNGEEGLTQAAEFDPDIIVLDVLMPKVDGRQMLRKLRQSNNWTPVVLLTQVGESTERAMALEEGADDYINKPFDPHELVARIKSILRRVKTGQQSLVGSQKLTSGVLILDRSARRIYVAEKEVPVTPKAVTLLEYLMIHPNELISRNRLLDAVWGWDYPAGIRAIDTRISELRRALADDPASPTYIETIPNHGYRFIAPVTGVV